MPSPISLSPGTAESNSSAPLLTRTRSVPDPTLDPHLRAAESTRKHLVMLEGVDTFVVLPGGAIWPVGDAVHARAGVRVISVRHEADAVFAAAGYARISGRLGVALVTSGPGVLNAVNELASE